MASAAVVSAVEARIATYWTATSYFSPNTVADTPTDGTAFLTIQFPLANAEQISVGAPGAQLFREEGGIRFVLSIPRSQTGGVAYWMGQMETLLANFRAKKFGGMQTFAPTSPVLDDSNDDGTYYKLSAVVPYNLNALG